MFRVGIVLKKEPCSYAHDYASYSSNHYAQMKCHYALSRSAPPLATWVAYRLMVVKICYWFYLRVSFCEFVAMKCHYAHIEIRTKIMPALCAKP